MKKIVIKISSSLLDPQKNACFIKKLADEVAILKKNGYQIIIVTSGAVMHGLKILNIEKKPKDLPTLQSAAAIGQIELMRLYQDLFKEDNLVTAQILVSSDDFKIRNRYLNLRNTVESLLELNAIPVFNENDSINIEELKLGDNDHLSALITIMMDFEQLILLTNVDGLYDKDPNTNQDAKLISHIDNLTTSYLKYSGESINEYSTGGMTTKLEAALKATKAGINVFIGNGNKISLLKILEKNEKGTFIKGTKIRVNARKRWLGLSPTESGSVTIDEGASRALTKNSSLLASGITGVEGKFEKGCLINILYADKKIAQGLTNYSSSEIDLIKGKKSTDFYKYIKNDDYQEVIHKNNLFLLS